MQTLSQQTILKAGIAANRAATHAKSRNAAKEIVRRFLLSKRALERQPVSAVVLRKSFLFMDSNRMRATSIESMRCSFEALAYFAGASGLAELAVAIEDLDATLPYSHLSRQLPGLGVLFNKGWCEFRFDEEEGAKLLSFVNRHGATFMFDHC
ncbi:hypothetical protein KB879_34005 (plasmid) [Cupriavidus sp. KK10]|jgi:hypothetical protein|uniref:hypothetical protein n=1 Tax=Cupriavidus sp. KK10 TaxID=1478019 RepID=UPI001BA77E89|nr:hypothetical protein [Cupriavidus sp. KK10]QUN32614.1 hypothetical protein KB879_34005 [Cupriavidus sp. KK10]